MVVVKNHMVAVIMFDFDFSLRVRTYDLQKKCANFHYHRLFLNFVNLTVVIFNFFM